MTRLSTLEHRKRDGIRDGFDQKKDRVASNVFYCLFVFLPIVESINGYINGGGNEGGLSLGIAYRLILACACLAILAYYGLDRKKLIIVPLAIIVLVLPHILEIVANGNAKGGVSFPALWLKTFLPILCIEAYRSMLLKDRGLDDLQERLFNVWTLLFPLCMLVPYVFGLGFNTYGQDGAGYKAFFFSQNDICFALVVLYAYSFFKMLQNPTISFVVRTLLLVACIILLGLKSGYILLLTLTVFFLLRDGSVSVGRRLLILLFAIFAFLLVLNVFSEQIEAVIARWEYFSTVLGDFIRFATSARIDRVPMALSYLSSGDNGSWILFGSGLEYSKALGSYALIEMDFFDMLFLFGVLGLTFYVTYYVKLYRSSSKNGTRSLYLSTAFWSAFVMAFLAGHVLVNSALSAMVFSAICCGLVSSSVNSQGDKKQCKTNARIER